MSKDSEGQLYQEFRTFDGMFSVTREQKIKSWNTTAEKLFGYRRDQVLGKKCYEVLCANSSTSRVKCGHGCDVVTNATKGRTTKDFDLECKTSEGEFRQINVSTILPSQVDESQDIFHVFRDVTDRRRVEIASTITDINGYRIPQLTTREDQVLKLLAAGKSTNNIADILTIRPLTARNHISRLLTKLGCRSRLEAVALGTRAGLI
ncbi:MAG TPA: LuxR C-terminal-related transcriptional regulator [Dehalococcoidia bacterium]|nr:LuxR C-terminal-related transcriptional regulator [Dehalococcoidia bacterium]MDP7262789.1 LuxR C-terminal-related transcriptional regulator [Dehalococcoidia bacterium]HJP27249.1 LuxR C-terminal-related transcriptional regulator [Dehalococcoidia bacterium]